MNSSLVLHLCKRLPAAILVLSQCLVPAAKSPVPCMPRPKALLHLICSGPLDQLIRLRKSSHLSLARYSPPMQGGAVYSDAGRTRILQGGAQLQVQEDFAGTSHV